MRVAMYYNNSDIRLEELPLHRIGRGEALVKVIASGICGSDVLEWYRIKTAPRVLGHEIAGEIVELGEGITRFKVGDKVFVFHHVPCNTCHYCLNDHHTACETLHSTNFDPGGFSEYIRVPAINVDRGTFVLPEEMSYEEGTFIEPLACVLHGQMLTRMKPGQSILILGSGISGLLHLQLARALGAGRIFMTDIEDFRLKMAQQFCADEVMHAQNDVPARVKELNENRLADLVIICTGAISAVEQALKSVDKGGTILFFAVPEPGKKVEIPITEFWRNEIALMTSYACSLSDIARVIELIRNRAVNVTDMITHRLSLAETGLGFKLISDAKESMKVIIEPQR